MYGVQIELYGDTWRWYADELGGSRTLGGVIPVAGPSWNGLESLVVTFSGGFYLSVTHRGIGDKWGAIYRVDVAKQLCTPVIILDLDSMDDLYSSIGCSDDGKRLRAFYWDYYSTEGLRIVSEDGESVVTTAMHFPQSSIAVSQRHTGQYLASVADGYNLYTSTDGVVWVDEIDLYPFAEYSEAYTEAVLYFGESSDGALLCNLDTKSNSYVAEVATLGGAGGCLTLNGCYRLSDDGKRLAYAVGSGYTVVNVGGAAVYGVSSVSTNTGSKAIVGVQGSGSYEALVLNQDGSVGTILTNTPYYVLISLGEPVTAAQFWTKLVGAHEIP